MIAHEEYKLELEMYNSEIIIIITNDMNSYIRENFEGLAEEMGDVEAGGLTMKKVGEAGNYYVLIEHESCAQCIVHESVHCINLIFHDSGYRLDFTNDELYAYHVGWLSEKIMFFYEEYIMKHFKHEIE